MTSSDSTRPRYRPVPAHVDLPNMEREILQLWADQGTFAASLDTPEDAPRWTFYEGPPTANGTPGTHHVEARVFKDVFPRFKTMQGYHVDRKAGWDCHGLPVEIAVEKELGLSGKPQIEAFGIEDFNTKCRDSVLRNVDLFEEMTDRMGYWVDMSNPYRTMDTEYVESVWWGLSQIFAKGLLTEDFRVSPYCPRCGTALSDHELAQGYETISDPSVFVRFPLASGELAERHRGLALLVWTTTPWTLVSNTACAVGEGFEYSVTRTRDGELLVVAEALREAVLGEDSEVLETLRGADLVGLSYRRPLELLDFPDQGPLHTVLAADFVTTEDGSGIVHEAPAFGAEDFALCRAAGLPIVNPIGTDGTFRADLELVGGQFFRDANDSVVADLIARDLLFKRVDIEHSYPHCWRCHTPLMYYAMPAWYIRTSQRKEELLAQNEATNWYPETIKHGRYGDWLNNNIDWALSRSRYWGAPLPIWRNDADPSKLVCISSLAELGEYAGRDLSDLDPHRPFIDSITFTIEGTEGTFRRVPEVIDAWFDSGAMPFAQWGYPHVLGSAEKFERAFPAQYICEAIDQTRGWFYSLMAVSTLIFDQNSYENVVCLGHILAEDGKKMSKHLGNILLPMPLMDEYGADAVRWFMACSGSAWSARRVGPTVLSEIVRKIMLTYWNTVSFHVLYARAADWSPSAADPAPADREVLDRWVLNQTQELIDDVTSALENFDTQAAGNRISYFIEGLSNLYVRRSRKRFWRGDPGALATLHQVVEVLTRLMAPLTPFITERVWQDVIAQVSPDAPTSVHLASWPVPDDSLRMDGISEKVALTRRIIELGRAARAEAKVRTRQPLRRALIGSAHHNALDADLLAEIAEELNVGTVESMADAGADLVEYSVKANFRHLGKRFAKRTPLVASAIAEADAGDLAAALTAGTAEVVVEGETISLDADDVIVAESPREGWSVVNEHGETVALDLELDDELRAAGLAREVVRVIQEARKNAGLEVTDRIRVKWAANDGLATAMTAHSATISEEILAVAFAAENNSAQFVDDELGLSFEIEKV